MTILLPDHHLSIEPGDEWVPDPIEPGAFHLGVYLKSATHGVYMNVREHVPHGHDLTKAGLLGVLREQGWGASIDEWDAAWGALVVVGGSFETVGMNGEIVLEVFVTDGRRVANLAGPGPRDVIAAVRPAVERLASTVRFA